MIVMFYFWENYLWMLILIFGILSVLGDLGIEKFLDFYWIWNNGFLVFFLKWEREIYFKYDLLKKKILNLRERGF